MKVSLLRAVLPLGLKVFSLSMRVQTFHATYPPKAEHSMFQKTSFSLLLFNHSMGTLPVVIYWPVWFVKDMFGTPFLVPTLI